MNAATVVSVFVMNVISFCIEITSCKHGLHNKMKRSSAYSIDWFVSWLVREEVLLAGLYEKNTVPAKNFRSFTTSHSQTNRLYFELVSTEI